jgi:tetratricopeptide (TPR) repeat protein
MSVEPGMELKGLQGMIRLLDAFPDTRAGKRALDHVVAVFQGTAQGQRWLRAFLAGRWRMHRKTGLAKFIAYEQGRLFARSADRPDWERAVRTMADIERLFPRSALWDDAVYARSELLHRLGRYEEELDALRLILKHRRRGLFGDVAETAYYHRSQWRVAQVLQHDLREFELAELALKYFVREFAFSRRFDDALYELAVVRVGMGRSEAALDALSRLAVERPESRFNRYAARLMETGVDPRRARDGEEETP